MKYKIIYADPPWSFKVWNKPKEGMSKSETSRLASRYYSTMKIEDIKNLPILNIADKNCVLFLWCTPPLMKEAMGTMQSWGFKYKTWGFVWIKMCRDGVTPRRNLGYWSRSNAEVCLIGVRGKTIPRVSKSISQIVITPQLKHSQKPFEIANRIVQLLGDLPRIELFARDKKEEWDATGLDLDGKDIREFLLENG